MYEKNCLHAGFLSQVHNALHMIVLQMHPASVQEKARVFDKVYTIDPDAQIHTVHAHTLHTHNNASIDMVLEGVKGPSSVIVCQSEDKLVALLHLFATEAKDLPCTVTGAKYHALMVDALAIDVLAKQAMRWEEVLDITACSSMMVGSLHVHAQTCVCALADAS